MRRWARLLRKVSFLVALATVAGCDADMVSGPITGCRAMAEPAIKVTPVDAPTNEPLGGVLVIARDGPYADSATTYFAGDDLIPANLGPERPGTYDVTAEKSGFAEWSRSAVVVESQRCGPKTVEIGARLSPLSD